MKKITLFVSLFFIVSYAITEYTKKEKKDCWTHKTNLVKGVTNTLNLCVDKEHGSLLIEYPNIGAIPTTCYQEGIKKNVDSGFVLELPLGECANGRKLERDILRCEKNDEVLICKDIYGGRFEFTKP